MARAVCEVTSTEENCGVALGVFRARPRQALDGRAQRVLGEPREEILKGQAHAALRAVLQASAVLGLRRGAPRSETSERSKATRRVLDVWHTGQVP